MVCEELNIQDQREFQKIYERELPKVQRAIADELVIRLNRRGAK
jgi:hypothetical protein